jgi:hypothetical protein
VWRFGGSESFLLDGNLGIRVFLRGRASSQKICVGKARGTLKAAAQFTKALSTGRVTAFRMNALKFGGKFGGAAVVAGAENEIQQFFKRRSMARGAAKNRFEKADGFLRQSVAGEEIDIRKRLRNKLLRFVVQRIFHERGNGSAACAA